MDGIDETGPNVHHGVTASSKTPRRKLKKQKKLLAQGKGKAEDYYDVYGPNAQADVIVAADNDSSEHQTLRINEVQNLVTWVLAAGTSPKWCFVKNKPLIGRLVLVFLPGLDASTYQQNGHLFKRLGQLCAKPAVTSCQDEVELKDPISFIRSLLSCPVSGKKKNSNKQKRAEEDQLSESPSGPHHSQKKTKTAGGVSVADMISGGPTPHPLSQFVLSDEQMREEQFPMLELQDGQLAPPPDYVVTKKWLPEASPPDMVAVDCEMVRTTQGLELARATLVDKRGKVLLDRLVLPPNPIVDYHTKFSGISMKLLQGVTATLQDVQDQILTLISSSTILVGHSLVNDLRALKLVHLAAMDTSLLFPHPRGPPYRPSLRNLTLQFLSRSIQQSEEGHDSAEDAKAAMDLALLKVKHGPSFGLHSRQTEGENLVNVLESSGRRCTIVDRLKVVKMISSESSSSISSSSDEESTMKAQQQLKASNDSHFIWTRLLDISTSQFTLAKDDSHVASRVAAMASLPVSNPSAVPPLVESMEAVFQESDQRIGKIYDSLARNDLFVVVTGHGDTALLKRLREQKWKGLQSLHTGCEEWTETREVVLKAFRKIVKRGLIFVSVKH